MIGSDNGSDEFWDPTGVEYEGSHEPRVDRATFDKVRELLAPVPCAARANGGTTTT